MIGWNFPLNNNGVADRINNAGIVTFKENIYGSLAREINQNSIDAHDHQTKRPVEVHFELTKVSTDLFPNRDEFRGALQSCRDYWNSHEQEESFFDKALNILAEDDISVLKISDYYTTGLTESDSMISGNWINLTKANGGTDKNQGAGGSFGIGKNAPFACTPLRTIFYGTKDIDGNEAFQGVARLVTHGQVGAATQGTGFYGLKEKNTPIMNMGDTPQFFRRDRVGTDLFIFGFDASIDWKERIIQSVLENFFITIQDGDLIVKVNDVLINNTTIGNLIATHITNSNYESHCDKYFDAFTSSESILKVHEDFEGMGRVELHILRKKNFPKRVAMARKTGMLIFEKGRFQTPMRFAGVFRATGDGINKLLRSLEPPEHNKWVPNLSKKPEDAAAAAKVIKNLYKWMNDCVRDVSSEAAEEEYDFEGMQQFLPDDLDDNPRQQDTDSEEQAIPAPVELVIRKAKVAPQPKALNPSKEAGEDESEDTKIGGNEGDGENTGGEIGVIEGGSAGDGKDGAEESLSSPNSLLTRSPVRLHGKRAFCINPNDGTYKVMFEPSKSGSGFVVLSVVGEVEDGPAQITSASIGQNSVGINHRGEIGPLPFIAGIKQEIIVVLSDRMHCALEVAAYEN